MADGVQYGIAVSLEHGFLEFAAAPPLVDLGKHVFHDIFGRHVVVTLDDNIADLHLFALADDEGDLVHVLGHISF